MSFTCLRFACALALGFALLIGSPTRVQSSQDASGNTISYEWICLVGGASSEDALDNWLVGVLGQIAAESSNVAGDRLIHGVVIAEGVDPGESATDGSWVFYR